MLHTTKILHPPKWPFASCAKNRKESALEVTSLYGEWSKFAYHGSLCCSRINSSPLVALVHVCVTDRVRQGYVHVTTSCTLTCEEGSTSKSGRQLI